MQSFIEFPKLGWTFNISDTLVSFKIFGQQLTIKWYGVLILIGFALAVLFALRKAPKWGVNQDKLIDVILVSTLFAFIGARIYYIVFSADRADYFAHPLTMLYIWQGGLAIYGGVIFAFATAIWMCRVRKLDMWKVFDLAGMGFLIGQGIGRWGNFFNQEAFGGNTTLPWGMTGDVIQSGVRGDNYTWMLPVHPTFLYESLWCLLGFALLYFISKKWYKFSGQMFCLYIVWYGIGRFMIEGLRTDSLMLGTMRVSQVVAAAAVVGGIALFFILKTRAARLPRELFVVEGEAPEDADEVADEELTEEDKQDIEETKTVPETEDADIEQAKADEKPDDAEIEAVKAEAEEVKKDENSNVEDAAPSVSEEPPVSPDEPTAKAADEPPPAAKKPRKKAVKKPEDQNGAAD